MLIVNTGYQLGDIQGMPEIPFQYKTVEGGLLLIRIMMLGFQETVLPMLDLVGTILAAGHVLLTNMIKHFGTAFKGLVVV